MEKLYLKFPNDGSGLYIEEHFPIPENFILSSFFRNIQVTEVVLDMTSTYYIDSITITYILRFYKVLQNAGKKFTIKGAGAETIKVIQFAKIAQILKNSTETEQEFYERCKVSCEPYPQEKLLFKFMETSSVTL